MSRYFAHSGPSPDLSLDGEPLARHLRGVAEAAARLAAGAATDPAFAAAARAAGLLHDLGKYHPEWQAYLAAEVRTKGSGRSVPHAVHGAVYAFSVLGHGSVALAVAAHHGGLDDAPRLFNALEGGERVPPAVLRELVRAARGEVPELPADVPLPGFATDPDPGADRRLEFWTRVLFSVLVDADRLETEQFTTGKGRTPARLDPAALLAELDRKRPQPKPGTATGLLELRNRVYDECLAAGVGSARGFFHLTVPTGGGKTRSGMAFALAHARAHALRRVFVVIPYLSIIEQNAREYRAVLGAAAVLEHHSAVAVEEVQAPGGDPHRSKSPAELAAENWDAPVVVTTSVQFLEGLLAASPRRCRRLHNVARSVVVFDEAQCLPTHLLDPLLDVFRDLVTNWGCSVVFSTATQPAFRHSPLGLTHGLRPDELKGILPADLGVQLFRDLQRVTYRNETATPWDWDELVERLIEAPGRQALCVLNTRKHARAVWEKLRAAVKDRYGEDAAAGVRHLSSAMCAEHRTAVLGRKDKVEPGTIYQRLHDGLPCWLVSTQVIECGVDVSFPRAFRAVGPLDAIVQVGGRVNREGERVDRGEVVVFRPADDDLPTGIYQAATGEALAVAFLTESGRLVARVDGPHGGNVLLRRSQYRQADDPVARAAVARCVIAGKVRNARNLLLRAGREADPGADRDALQAAAARLGDVLPPLATEADVDAARGREGDAARVYFDAFPALVRQNREAFTPNGRTRRPPLDRMNALLSFLYGLLCHDCTAACAAAGLDPAVGFLHVDRPGRPGLALDLMEEFRPLLADRLALALVNRQQVPPDGFETRDGGAVAMTDATRRAVVAAYQQRKREEVTHPLLSQKTPVGRLPFLQARVLARHLRGDLPSYVPCVLKN